MYKDDRIRMQHMLDAAKEAESFAIDRSRLIHAYYDIDLDRVWDTVIEDLPPLILMLEKILIT